MIMTVKDICILFYISVFIKRRSNYIKYYVHKTLTQDTNHLINATKESTV